MSHMKDLCETTQKELQELLEKQTTQNEQIAQLTEKLKVFSRKSEKRIDKHTNFQIAAVLSN